LLKQGGSEAKIWIKDMPQKLEKGFTGVLLLLRQGEGEVKLWNEMIL
jgi:hypothetical protein